jgi:hypothetical protein
VSGAKTAARVIEGAQLALFTTGHTPFAEDTAGFLRVLESFVRRAADVSGAARAC